MRDDLHSIKQLPVRKTLAGVKTLHVTPKTYFISTIIYIFAISQARTLSSQTLSNLTIWQAETDRFACVDTVAAQFLGLREACGIVPSMSLPKPDPLSVRPAACSLIVAGLDVGCVALRCYEMNTFCFVLPHGGAFGKWHFIH